MTDWGLQPNVVTHHIMISHYCSKGKVVALARGWRIQLALMSLWGHDAPTASSNQTLRHDSAFIKPRCMASKPGP
ncbi:hypothetical protein WN943_016396 [Citrus x changshan-huyou]